MATEIEKVVDINLEENQTRVNIQYPTGLQTRDQAEFLCAILDATAPIDAGFVIRVTLKDGRFAEGPVYYDHPLVWFDTDDELYKSSDDSNFNPCDLNGLRIKQIEMKLCAPVQIES